MTKVLMCGNHPTDKGGMTSVIRQIREHDWESEGIELSFIPTFMPGNIAKKTLFFAGAYLRIAFRMAFDKPDAVHIHMSYKGSFTRANAVQALCRAFHVKDIIHVHGSEFEKWYDSLAERKRQKIRKFLREASVVIVLGEKWEKILRRIEPAAKTTVLSNAVSIPKELPKRNGETTDILFLGVLTQRKGVADLLNAVRMLADSGRIGKMHFTIAGSGKDEEKLKKQADELGINNYVSFVGWISGERKKELLQQSRIMVLPSYNEGLPISILEALSYGMPVAATDVGDIPSAVEDKVNGRLFKPGDIEAMAEALTYTASEENYGRLSAQARKTAEDRFSEEQFYQRLLAIYSLQTESSK